MLFLCSLLKQSAFPESGFVQSRMYSKEGATSYRYKPLRRWKILLTLLLSSKLLHRPFQESCHERKGPFPATHNLGRRYSWRADRVLAFLHRVMVPRYKVPF